MLGNYNENKQKTRSDVHNSYYHLFIMNKESYTNDDQQ